MVSLANMYDNPSYLLTCRLFEILKKCSVSFVDADNRKIVSINNKAKANNNSTYHL